MATEYISHIVYLAIIRLRAVNKCTLISYKWICMLKAFQPKHAPLHDGEPWDAEFKLRNDTVACNFVSWFIMVMWSDWAQLGRHLPYDGDKSPVSEERVSNKQEL
jgi:hypothetical protein